MVPYCLVSDNSIILLSSKVLFAYFQDQELKQGWVKRPVEKENRENDNDVDPGHPDTHPALLEKNLLIMRWNLSFLETI